MSERARSRRTILGLAAALLLGPAAAAQFHSGATEHFAGGAPVAHGDLDGDGDLDLVVVFGSSWSGMGGEVQFHRNDGSGIFSVYARIPVCAGSIALVDVDNDGDLDLFVGVSAHPSGPACLPSNLLLLNDGTGRFTDVSATHLPYDQDLTADVVAGDVDNDGDLDLCLATNGSAVKPPPPNPYQNRLYLNNGLGVFRDATFSNLPVDTQRTSDLILADVDGDSDLDLFSLGSVAQTGLPDPKLLLNNGNGSFVEAPPGSLSSSSGSPGACGDLDADGDVDLVVANGFSGTDLHWNDGRGVFSLGANIPFLTRYVRLVDFDRDGLLDVTLFGEGPIQILKNQGGRSFVQMPWRLPARNVRAFGPDIADVDRDGDLDIALGGGVGTSAIWFNDGAGFVEAGLEHMLLLADRSWSVALGDVDGDGFPDLVVGNSQGDRGQQNRLYRNDGTGRFVDVTSSSLPAFDDMTNSVLLVDVDADGDLDLFVGNGGSGYPNVRSNELYFNDGKGVFTIDSDRFPADYSATWDSRAADFTGDGRVDILATSLFGTGPWPWRNGEPFLYLNEGKGRFSVRPSVVLQRGYPYSNSRLAVGDLDGDGDQDVILGSRGLSIWSVMSLINDGTGYFRSVPLTIDRASRALDVALADVDKDGDLDVAVLFQVQTPPAPVVRLFTNDGSGKFGEMIGAFQFAGGSANFNRLGFTDVDRDGDLDLLVAGPPGVFLNDGTGTFVDATQSWLVDANFYGTDMLVGDLDLDGDHDVVVARDATPSVTFFNRFRSQVHIPYLPRIGRPLTLDFHSSAGPSTVWPVLGPRRIRPMPIPGMGLLQIDLASAVVLPSAAIMTPSTQASVVLGIPNAPVLLGAAFYVQALYVPAGSGTPFLSGLVRGVLVQP